MYTLPFRLRVPSRESVTLGEVSETTFRFHGLLRLEPDGLWIEWSGTAQLEEVGLGTVREETVALPREGILLPYHRLLSIDYRSLWWPHVELAGGDLDALRVVPSEDRGRVRCFVKWRERRAAAEFVAAARIMAQQAVLPGWGGKTPVDPSLPHGPA